MSSSSAAEQIGGVLWTHQIVVSKELMDDAAFDVDEYTRQELVELVKSSMGEHGKKLGEYTISRTLTTVRGNPDIFYNWTYRMTAYTEDTWGRYAGD